MDRDRVVCLILSGVVRLARGKMEIPRGDLVDGDAADRKVWFFRQTNASMGALMDHRPAGTARM